MSPEGEWPRPLLARKHSPQVCLNPDEKDSSDRRTHDSCEIGRTDLELCVKSEDEGVSEAKLIRKVDIHVLPILCAINLLSFLDRYVVTLRAQSFGDVIVIE